MGYVRCVNNSGYAASLTVGRIYKTLPHDSDQVSLRIIDNEGEDYLYDATRFEPVVFPDTLAETTATPGIAMYQTINSKAECTSL